VLTETGVLGSDHQFPPTMRLSRSWEERPWHAS
jgi:hypothetical protein